MAVSQTGTPASQVTTPDDVTATLASFTVPSGATALVVELCLIHYAAVPAISSVTFGATGLSLVTGTEATNTFIGTNYRIASYVLLSPTASTADVVVTMADDTYLYAISCSCYTGSATSSATEGGTVTSGTSGSANTDISIAPSTTTSSGSTLIGQILIQDLAAGANTTCSDTQLAELDLAAVGECVSNVGYDDVAGAGEAVAWQSTGASRPYVGSVFVLLPSGGTTTHTATGELVGGGGVLAGAASRTGDPAPPVITSVSTVSPAYLGQYTIFGSTFGTTQESSTVTLGGVAQSVVSWADSQIVCTAQRGTNKYGVPLTLVVTTPYGSDSDASVTGMQPQAGWSFINLGTPHATVSKRLRSTAVDLAAADQVAWENLGTGAIIYDDGTGSVSAAVTEFDAEAWTSLDGWGAIGLQTIGAAGTTHTATGALIGGGGALQGVARNYRVYTSTGVLAGGGGALSGTAVHTTAGFHTATGELVGGGGVLSGVASKKVLHTATGELVGGGGVLSGVSAHDVGVVARPDQDITTGGWVPSQGGALYDMLDEVAPDDSDYISATAPGAPCRIGIADIPDPVSSAGHVIKYRAWAPAGKGLRVRLISAGQVITTILHTSLPTTPTEFTYTLSTEEADAIADYSDLSFEIDVV